MLFVIRVLLDSKAVCVGFHAVIAVVGRAWEKYILFAADGKWGKVFCFIEG